VDDADWIRSSGAEVLRLAPDVILANASAMAPAAHRATRTVPIVFIGPPDPVADGLVESLAHPGGNATGFTVFEPSLGAKLLELLKEVAPRVTHVAVMTNPDSPAGGRFHDAAAAAAQKLAIPLVATRVREPKEIEAAMTTLGREGGYGLIVPPDPSTITRRKLIVELAARHRLPAAYAVRVIAVEGGLVSYGFDLPELFRQAATYADRILRGEKPANLPVQQPTKFELVIARLRRSLASLSLPRCCYGRIKLLNE
jgi:putative ABC transport system substrate-binding protein